MNNPASAHPGTWRTYSTADGLPSVYCEHIAQDANGYLWIATAENGVCRYDGDEFRTFTTQDGLCGNQVYSVLCDRQGRVWFGTLDNGVCFYDGGAFQRPDGNSANTRPTLFLYEDPEGRIWNSSIISFGYFEGTSFRDLTARLREEIADLPYGGQCYGMVQDREGQIWFHAAQQLIRFDGEHFHSVEANKSGNFTLAVDAEHTLWVGWKNTLRRWDGCDLQPLDWPSGRAGIRKLQTDRRGRLWISTIGDGVFCREGNDFLHFTAATGLPHGNVNGICEDDEGQIWFATWGGGLACWDPHGLDTVDRSPLPYLLAQQDQRRVWILRSSLTTEHGGPYRSSPDREQLSFSDVNQSVVTQRDIDIDALSIAADPQGDLWIGGQGGLRHLTTATSERLDLAEDIVVTAILPVAEGLYLGLRTASNDHIQFAFHDGKNLQIIWEKRSDEHGALPPILRIIRTRDQDIWFVCHFSHQAGYMYIWSPIDRFLARWNPSSGLTWYSTADGLPNNRVYDVLEDRAGVLWVATWGGIGRYDGTRLEHVVSPNTPDDQAALCIFENRQGHLLFGTSTGALRYNGQIFQTLGSQALANVTSIAEDARDRLWFSTPQGTKRYTPAKVPPRVRLTQTIADQIHENVDEIRTSTATRQIIFEYKGMSYRTHPRDLLYRHRLQGLEDDWQPPTRATRAIYRDLPPGDYTFAVKAIDRDLNESATATIRLQVVPDARDQRIDELEQRVKERTAALEEANTRLERENAAERVRAQALAMKTPGDIYQVVGVMFAEMKKLIADLNAIDIAFPDEAEDRITQYVALANPRQRGIEWTATALLEIDAETAAYSMESSISLRTDDYMERWRQGDAWSFRFDEIRESVQKISPVYDPALRAVLVKIGFLRPDGELHDHSLTVVPFAEGSVAIHVPQRAEEHVAIAREFTEALSLGYLRFLELQDAEARTRQAQIEAAVERVRAEVTGMQQSTDIAEVVGVMWEELKALGLDFATCSIAITDEDRDFYISYNVWEEAGIRRLEEKYGSLPYTFSYIGRGLAVAIARSLLNESKDLSPALKHPASQIALSEEELTQVLDLIEMQFGVRFTPEDYGVRFWSKAPFEFGALSLGKADTTPLSDADMALLQRIADVFSSGYARYLDFQRLERDSAVERIRTQVFSMQQAQDLDQVVLALGRELNSLDISYHTCGLQILGEGGTHAARIALRAEGRAVERGQTSGWQTHTSVYKAWETQQVVYRADLQQDNPYNEESLLVSGLRAVVDVPFRYGTLALSSENPNAFWPPDIEILQAFAAAIEGAYARHLDFQKVETQARQLARESTLERIRAEVASMQQSDDIGRVMGLIFAGIRELDVDTDTAVVMVIDEEAETIRQYGMIPQSFYERGFKGTPVVANVVEGVDLYRGDCAFFAGEDQTVNVRRTQQSQLNRGLDQDQESRLSQLKITKKQWNFTMPLDLAPISNIIVPFSHGTLLFNSSQVDAFSEDDLNIAEDFGRMISLGYSRHVDFQRLEESNRQIQQATQHKSNFLARMSHDLRTPMNAIIGYTRILLRRSKDALEPRQLQNLENIETSAQNLLKLINEILDLSRIEAGRVEVHAADVDMQQLVAECATAIMPLVRPEVELIQDLADAPALYTDADLMRRVVMNILSNAVKFTDTGRITVALTTADDGITLTIADTGPGIPASDLPHIFEEFRQVEGESAIKTQEGSGLGLAIVKKTVELLGGEVSVDSTVGEGTTFALKIADYEN